MSESAHVLDKDEVFLVTSASIRLSADGPALSAGDCAIVPAGTAIQLANPADEPATAHVMIRAGFSAALTDGTAIGTPPWAA